MSKGSKMCDIIGDLLSNGILKNILRVLEVQNHAESPKVQVVVLRDSEAGEHLHSQHY